MHTYICAWPQAERELEIARAEASQHRQELAHARAALGVARATNSLAHRTPDRFSGALTSTAGLVSTPTPSASSPGQNQRAARAPGSTVSVSAGHEIESLRTALAHAASDVKQLGLELSMAQEKCATWQQVRGGGLEARTACWKAV